MLSCDEVLESIAEESNMMDVQSSSSTLYKVKASVSIAIAFSCVRGDKAVKLPLLSEKHWILYFISLQTSIGCGEGWNRKNVVGR